MKEINRDLYLNELISKRSVPLIKIITGIRRSGKSYLLNPIFKNYLRSNGVAEDHILYLNFELVENEILRDKIELYNYVIDSVKDDGEYFILLDEIQMVEGFESVLSSFLAKGNLNVYVTGSNSKFLSSDIVTEFRGRSVEIHMYPLSFKEFMSAYEGNRYDGWQEYMRYGGLPILMRHNDGRQKMEYLEEIRKNIYLKDIVERYKMRNDAALEALLNIIASGVGSLTNSYKLENTFRSEVKIDLSHNTINDYLGKLCDAYIIEKAMRYDVKGKQYISTPQKYYFTDIGIRNAFVGFRQNDEGHIMENIIYIELRRRGYQVDVGVVNADNKQVEIDFVANRGDRRYYVQSALTLGTPEKRLQELRSLTNTGDFFKRVLVTNDMMLPGRDDSGVAVMNVLDFLLDEDSLEKEM